jgi:predicted phosphate transport protein (TIGR00153 family)
MRLPLIPREEKFFDMFVEDAANVLAAARILETFFRSYGERERIAAQLLDLEHQGDQISHEIGHKLESTFVTPFDREDIHALISRLDDILDLIEEVADTCILYNISAPTEVAVAQAEIIVKQCIELREALTKLRHFKGVEPHWIEIHRLENEGDQVARKAIAGLFVDGTDPLDVIKWKDVYTLMEDAIDAGEDAANVIERIVVKHA